MTKLIVITSDTCVYCAVQKEILRRLLPKFPDIEPVYLDRSGDQAAVEQYKNHGVPCLIIGDSTLTGSHTLADTAAFLRGELNDEIIEAGIANPHYLDNAATTPVCEEAIEAADKAMREQYGNPSSIHYKGRVANALLQESRETIADAIGADPKEIFFTSCGSESDNWAIIRSAEMMRAQGRHIISSDVEHDAVRMSLAALEHEGFEVTRVQPDETGRISVDRVREALRPDTILVSLMMVNNETGAVNDIAGIAKMLREEHSAALLHTDAVQGFMKIPFDAHELGADMISFSGHKIHAPKGIAALYIRDGIDLPPYILGGGQERGHRAGTESVPLIAAFAAAVKAAQDNFEESILRMRSYRSQILERLQAGIHDLQFIEGDAPHIINLSIPGTRSEVLLNYLSQRGVFISNSSACKRGARSHVLEAIGKDEDYISGAIRISLSRMTTQADVDAVCQVLVE